MPSGRRPDAEVHRFKRMLEESGAHLRFHKILKQTEKEENFLKAYEFCCDHAFGKAPQAMDVTNYDGERPTTDTLIQTITTLRSELDNLRRGTGVETSK